MYKLIIATMIAVLLSFNTSNIYASESTTYTKIVLSNQNDQAELIQYLTNHHITYDQVINTFMAQLTNTQIENIHIAFDVAVIEPISTYKTYAPMIAADNQAAEISNIISHPTYFTAILTINTQSYAIQYLANQYNANGLTNGNVIVNTATQTILQNYEDNSFLTIVYTN